MENRKPFNLNNILILYNFLQVIFSTWLFYEVRILQIYLYTIFYTIQQCFV